MPSRIDRNFVGVPELTRRVAEGDRLVAERRTLEARVDAWNAGRGSTRDQFQLYEDIRRHNDAIKVLNGDITPSHPIARPSPYTVDLHPSNPLGTVDTQAVWGTDLHRQATELAPKISELEGSYHHPKDVERLNKEVSTYNKTVGAYRKEYPQAPNPPPYLSTVFQDIDPVAELKLTCKDLAQQGISLDQRSADALDRNLGLPLFAGGSPSEGERLKREIATFNLTVALLLQTHPVEANAAGLHLRDVPVWEAVNPRENQGAFTKLRFVPPS